MEKSDKIKWKMEAIWKARDNEAGAIKDRALLVWGFLMFCYSGYGILAMRLLFPTETSTIVDFRTVNMILLVLSLICLRLSAYWVQMAKGAKAWAETFDYMAEGFQHDFLELTNPKKRCPAEYLKDNHPDIYQSKCCSNCKGDVSYACLLSVFPLEIDNPNLAFFPHFDKDYLTTYGGAYSPAKIIVAVSRLSLGISALLVTIHFSVALIKSNLMKCALDCVNDTYPLLIWLVLWILILILVIWFLAKCRRIRSVRQFFLVDMGVESDGLNQIITIHNHLEAKLEKQGK